MPFTEGNRPRKVLFTDHNTFARRTMSDVAVVGRRPAGARSTEPRKPAAKLSEVEYVKLDSARLRGSIAAGLADPEADRFVDDDASVLKFHGIYQQYDRDTATERKQRGQGK